MSVGGGVNRPPIRTGGHGPGQLRQPAEDVRLAAGRSPEARRAAWDAYRVVTGGLLTAAHDPHIDPGTLNVRLGTALLHIVRSASLWGEHGPMLLSAARTAVALLRADDRDGLAGLAQLIADRLYLLSAGPPRLRTGPSNRAAW
jgi:hypothetical protein